MVRSSAGRILGPFSQSQLASLRDRGRFSEDDEVSHDRRSWMKASEVPGVYSRPTSVQTQSATAADAEWPVVSLSEDAGVVQLGVVSAAELVWFVARGDSHQGPVSQSDVERWLSTGEIGPGTLIWKQGMPTWLAASQVPELRLGLRGSRSLGRRRSQPVHLLTAHEWSGGRQPGAGPLVALRNRQSACDHLRRHRALPDLALERRTHGQEPGRSRAHSGRRRADLDGRRRDCIRPGLGLRRKPLAARREQLPNSDWRMVI